MEWQMPADELERQLLSFPPATESDPLNVIDTQIPARFVADWAAILQDTSPETREIVRDLVWQNEQELWQRYQDYLLADPDLAVLMRSSETLQDFATRFIGWVKRIVDPYATVGDVFFAEQQEIGEVLARIGFPPHALS